MGSCKECPRLRSEYWFGLNGGRIWYKERFGLLAMDCLEKACVSRPGQLLHCIDATGELPPMFFAEQTINTTNV